MDPIRLGLSLRALRIRRGWRQEDVGSRAGLSHALISKIERGQMRSVSIGSLERVAALLDARLDVLIRWRGEALDRLLDEGHARLVEEIVRILAAHRWEVAVEVTFAVYGERGSINVLAFHPLSGTLLVVEVKTVMPDVQSLLAAHDRKVRLAPRIAGDRGWPVVTTASRLVVFEATPIARQRVQRLDSTLRVAFPSRGVSVRRWLATPAGALAGLLFVRTATPGSTNSHVAGRQRVRHPRCAANAIPGRDRGQLR